MSKIHLMAAHFAAFSARMAMPGVVLEIRETAGPGLDEISRTLDKIGRGFEEYKSANDQRLAELSNKGSADPITEARLKKLDDEMDQLSELKKNLEDLAKKAARPGIIADFKGNQTPEQRSYSDAFSNWMRNPGDPERQMQLRTAQKTLESRAAQTTTLTGSAGGFALPEQIEQTIARLSRDISPIRSIATVRTVGTSDYKELFDVNGAAFEWVGETDTRSQTNTPDLAEVAPTFGMASARPRVSEESLDDLFFDVESWLATSVAETMAAGEGLAYVSGNGTKRPTGFLAGPTPLVTTDASRAFGTLQYIASGQAAAMPTSLDTMYDIVYSLRARYRANANWLTSKLLLSALRKYKDSTGQYLWQNAVALGQPDSFMGYRVVEAEDMPAVAAGTFPLAFGDFREGYLIAERVGMRVTKDDITLPGFVQWYIRKRVGGRIRNSEAIKLLKIAAT